MKFVKIIMLVSIIVLGLYSTYVVATENESGEKVISSGENTNSGEVIETFEDDLYSGEDIASKRVFGAGKVNPNIDFPDLTIAHYNNLTKKYWYEDHPDKREILMAARIGVIDGYDDGTFKPDNPITRAEFIKMLMCLATNRTFNFASVPTTYTSWARNYVSLAEMQGIIEKGKYSDQDLEKPITRLEVVCMLAKVQIKMKNIPQNQLGHLIFTDIDGITEEEKELLLHAASYDLLEGMLDGSMTEFEPNKNITRAETARALMRIY